VAVDVIVYVAVIVLVDVLVHVHVLVVVDVLVAVVDYRYPSGYATALLPTADCLLPTLL